MYDININVVKECRQPTELHIYLIDKLNCNTEEEILFVQQRSVDLFLTNNVHNWSQLEGFHLNLIEIIRNCTLNTLVHLTNLLGGHDQPLQDAKVLNTLLMVLRTYPKRWTTNILKYATQHLDLNETKNLIEDMISNCNDVWELGQILMTKSLPQSTIIKGLLHSDISLGVRRIDLPIAASMKDRLPLSFKDNPSDYQMQVRLMLPKILQPQYCLPADAILYMTNAPFDEYTSPKFGDWQDMDEIEKCRSKLIVKREIVSVN
ncbi:GH17217 [Drosophila grimshawi]|uniref:GH17217 n=1 Tax=Drosophila grimshawi TaxID=7222 RepID=B4JFU9_DROGR|nr:GH17217 [Drosophila grimshawi]